MSPYAWLPLAALVLRALSLTASAADVHSPLSPEESLQHFRLEPGFAIELVACEPAVVDPIAIRFDEDGRLWVVEMRDYPHGPPAGQPPLSQIRVLSDVDGDGRYETSRVFADKLLFPTGLQPWQGGVIVTMAGQVVYLPDVDGDGRAETAETWFRGFTAENPQLRANHPRFAADNRIYIANGLRGGVVENLRHVGKPQSISGLDFAFDPRTGGSQPVSGNGQFGLAFDDFANRFVCNNREPVNHVVLENRYLARNPFLAVPAVVNLVAPAGEQSHVFPLVKAWTTSNLHAGQFTAACGIEIYRGDLWGDAYRGNAFICEPTGSLVHREILEPRGASFTSHRAREGEEFLASTDDWFRPVNLELGPDGALYVVDMYRAVIEHPQYMPSELQRRADLRLGDDRGRIYRIVPRGPKRPAVVPHLSRSASRELVALLGHPNAWWRETTARLLYQRQDAAVTPDLEQLASTAREPVARVHALWALAGLNVLTPPIIAAALSDASPRVREQGVALAETLLADSPAVRQKVVALAADSDARVRFRVALALGGQNGDDLTAPLASIVLAAPDDEWTRRAVATALPERQAPLLFAVLESPRLQGKNCDAAEVQLVRELATIVGSRRENVEIARAITQAGRAESASSATAQATLLGLAQGLERRGGSLVDCVAKSAAAAAALPDLVTAAFNRARATVLDESAEENARAESIDLLRYAQTSSAGEALLHIVTMSNSQRLRLRAAGALAAYHDAATATALLAALPTQTPPIRRTLLDALIGSVAPARKLLDELAAGRMALVEIDATREKRLREHADPAVREQAKALFAGRIPAERRTVLAEYQAALTLEGRSRVGKELFRQHCATCHHVGDVGVDVAPDISDSRVKTAAQLLTDILNPNQAIDNNYISYTIATRDGDVHVGIIGSETASSITLRQAENKSLALLRADVETMRSNGVSLMPEGFEKHLSHQQMADLIAFVKNWRYLERPIPGTIGAGPQ